MAVKIRLARRGRKKLATFDVIVADSRSPRDGKFIEKIGTYNPRTNPATINLDDQKAFDWLMKGAQPSDTVRRMLSYRGVMLRKHLQLGVAKGAVTQEAADSKFADWIKSKESKIQSKVDSLSKAKETAAKARKEAESKVREARAEAIKKKNDARAAEEAAAVAQTPAQDVATPAEGAAPAETAEQPQA